MNLRHVFPAVCNATKTVRDWLAQKMARHVVCARRGEACRVLHIIVSVILRVLQLLRLAQTSARSINYACKGVGMRDLRRGDVAAMQKSGWNRPRPSLPESWHNTCLPMNTYQHEPLVDIQHGQPKRLLLTSDSRRATRRYVENKR